MHTPSSAEMHAMQAAAIAALSPFSSFDAFNKHLPMAEFLAKSTIIHDVLQGNPANCMLVMEVAIRLNVPVMSLAQDLEVVDGKLTWPKPISAAMTSIGAVGTSTMPTARSAATHAVAPVNIPTAHATHCADERNAQAASVTVPVAPVTPAPVQHIVSAERQGQFAEPVEKQDPGSLQSVAAKAAAPLPSQCIDKGASASVGPAQTPPKKNGDQASGAAVATANAIAPDPAAPSIEANIDLATFKEICLRADTAAQVAAAAAQLPSVLKRDRSNAEKEVLEVAMILMAEESTAEGMANLKSVTVFLNPANLAIFKAAYNGRVDVLNGAK